MPARPPIVTFLTDFGHHDWYVAAMKAAVLVHARRAVQLVDVSHAVEPQDVIGGAFLLERAVASFPPGTIHVAVIDPGVGTDRRLLVVQINRQTVLCPDNGLVTWVWRRNAEPPPVAGELTWRPEHATSNTFHGRDILAPMAGRLVAGAKRSAVSRTLSGPLLLDLHPSTGDGRGVIIHFDHYGNATTNIPADQIPPAAIVRVGRRTLGPVRRTYGDVAIGSGLALIGSAGLLELAVRNGSAKRTLRLKVGDPVRIEG